VQGPVVEVPGDGRPRLGRRAVFLAAGGALIGVPGARGQQAPGKVWRIGVLSSVPTPVMTPNVEALRVALRERGYVDGRNLVLDFRSTEGNDERLSEFAADFVREKVDLIVTHGLAPIVVKRATSTIPVVIPDSGDLVAMGVVESLARPGGNITGQVFFGRQIAAKRVELLKEALPKLTHVGILHVESKLIDARPTALLERAAQLKLKASVYEVAPGDTDYSNVFAAMARDKVQAVTFFDLPALMGRVGSVAEQARKHRIATAGNPRFADAGGLIGYGVRFADLWASSAVFIDKIFKGAKPGEIPITQPTKFHLVANLPVARAIGVELPQSFLVQADQLIQ
jgi:putative ABC transport system substrate-binding protein